MSNTICVIGAGIVGVSTALWLQRQGHDVILLDRDTPGQAASFGNAGLIAQWGSVPVNTPGIWRELPSMLFNPKSALFVRWQYLPKMVPWLVQFMRHANDAKAQSVTKSLHGLLYDALDQHKQLARGTAVEQWITDSKLSYIYKTRADFEASAYSWQLKRELGFIPDVFEGQDVQDQEPNLGSGIGFMAQLSGHGHILNPGEYVRNLAKVFEQNGGKFIQTAVTDFVKTNGQVTQVLTDQGALECSKIVITSGIWSKPLMQRLGLKVPLETERGYHIVFKNADGKPSHPMMAAGKFAMTPMGDDLRCAGTVELGGLDLPPSAAPLEIIRDFVKIALPNLRASETSEWMGFRPSTPDSMPLIGHITGTNIYTGFGHQHIGLTAGPKTGQILAQMIAGQPINTDYSAFDPNRYTS